MRISLLLAATLLVPVMLTSQQRFLIAPNAEVIPLSPQQSAAEVIKHRAAQTRTSAATCPDKFTFGYAPEIYTVNSNFGSYHRQVLGEWFVAPASGTIDSIFWYNRGFIGAYDSTIYLRVHRSNIGPSYGPGARPGPFNPPCQNWGYWINSGDSDQHVAAFLEDATDTTWISTINGSSSVSTPPFGQELWGLGGYPVRIHPSTVGFAAMSDLATPLPMSMGDKFFVSLRIANARDSVGGHKEPGTEDRTEWNASGFTVGTNDPDYPSRDWKFYEHDKGPSNCSGFSIDSIQKGWVARGGFGADSLSVAVYSIWYVMSVVSNVPPVITDADLIHTSLSLGPWDIEVEISDCNPENPLNAGVDSAFIEYTVNSVPQNDVPMVNSEGLIWWGSIPTQTYGVTVRYRVKAVDKDGAVGFTRYNEFRVIGLWNQWYEIDTSGACVHQDIRTSGSRIPRSAYFSPPARGGINDLDNGTAGSFDMGGEYIVFGDTFRYAWVGINGAIALSKSPTDTIDVNANGNYNSSWDFPSATYTGRENPSLAMPRMFIAPFWSDFIFAQSFPSESFPGFIMVGSGGDSCYFIVEWDSMSSTVPSELYPATKFRVVLNRCTGAVEFQYDDVQMVGIDSTALVGMQLDTSSTLYPNPYVFINNHMYPYETKPRNNWCVKMTPATPLGIAKEIHLPAVYALSQNYPNPFNPSTTIGYSVPSRSHVTLAVYNLLGEHVTALVDETIEPGVHAVSFDASGLSSGVYFYQLRAGNYTDTRKLLLMR